MNPLSSAIAAVGLSSSRAFIPAFVAALLLRFGQDHDTVRQAGQQLIGTAHVASWFTSDPCLAVLGVLAVLEVVAQKNQDVRAWMTDLDHYAKPAMAIVLQLGLLSATDADTVQKITATTQQASFLTPFFSLAVGFFTWLTASARNSLHRVLHDADPDNATGVHRILAWSEDLYAIFGTALFLLFPVFISGVIGLGILALLLLQRRAQAREDAGRVACHNCQAPLYRSALACPACDTPNPNPTTVGFLGASTLTPVPADLLAVQPLTLATKRRCPRCASRLSRDPLAACPACAHVPFASPDFVDAYDAHLTARLIPTLIVTSALGLVPYVGLVPAVLFYRVHLVSPYRTWLGFRRNILTRWLLRLTVFVLILLHLVPLAGVLAGPLMALLNYLFFRSSFLAVAQSARPPATPPVPALPLA